MGTPVDAPTAIRANTSPTPWERERSPSPERSRPSPESKESTPAAKKPASSVAAYEFDTPDIAFINGASKFTTDSPQRSKWYQALDEHNPVHAATMSLITAEALEAAPQVSRKTRSERRAAFTPATRGTASSESRSTLALAADAPKQDGGLVALGAAVEVPGADQSHAVSSSSAAAPTGSSLAKKKDNLFVRRTAPLPRQGRVTGSPSGKMHANPERRRDIRQADMVSNIDWVARRIPTDTESECKVKEASWVPSQAWFESLRYYPSGKDAIRDGDSELTFSGNTHSTKSRPLHLETDVRTRLGLASADPEWTDEQLPFTWAPNVGQNLGRRNRRRLKPKTAGSSDATPPSSPPEQPPPKTRAQEALEKHAKRVAKSKDRELEASPYTSKSPARPARRAEKAAAVSASPPTTVIATTKDQGGREAPKMVVATKLEQGLEERLAASRTPEPKPHTVIPLAQLQDMET